ncbi:MAG: hypothetical protein CL693_15775 [Cellvibrionaceae bacterium]|nr:hypothetical protein [Cellvibrionaceae bacterium]|tara:strand:+ start:27692 stop:28858 length:1167 start_codon:yes stop_codon:yes gene_type:complete
MIETSEIKPIDADGQCVDLPQPPSAVAGDSSAMRAAKVVKEKGNTPLKKIPDDYLGSFDARWLILAEGPDAGKKLFFYDQVIGEGEPEETLLLVHGNPECSYTYRQTVDAVARKTKRACRVVAMDHIGFGLSDQASFEMVDMHHANNLKQLILHLDLTRVTLVIHDWGGAIGIGATIDTPERVDNLVLMNTTVFPMPLRGWNFRNFPFSGKLSWNSLGYLMPWRWWRAVPPTVMYSGVGRWGLMARALSVCLRSMLGRLSSSEQLYWDMFKSKTNALSSMRNVKQTKVWGHGYCYFDAALGWQDNRDFYHNVQEKLGACWGVEGRNIGVRAFWGTWDPTAQPSVRGQWLQVLPQMEGNICLYPQRGHFVEESEYEAIADGIIDVMKLA